ncbi:PREDICTED: uncharacterized protein LOC108768535 isoform X1 [Trachymyrmex cornetzi]|uniref:uncharacterized protein LOC108768535 isoform X1 n=1 Tax=Trachymyrmex cornetzi TaxID=471704 RepID=UPI00084EE1D4|nr:PREDICTED: uncharacterized protein LOC108768535 isoform X1 [Trachymyrmex cornetzi]XP_018374498.1 PREDICTED: uncharacterized protein LOC108768535 isoform X1 [Trachymyrmex cornetzi]
MSTFTDIYWAYEKCQGCACVYEKQRKVYTCGMCETILDEGDVNVHECFVNYPSLFCDKNTLYLYPQCVKKKRSSSGCEEDVMKQIAKALQTPQPTLPLPIIPVFDEVDNFTSMIAHQLRQFV